VVKVFVSAPWLCRLVVRLSRCRGQNWIDFIYVREMVQVFSLCVTHSRF
jgi:hypothetical protein